MEVWRYYPLLSRLLLNKFIKLKILLYIEHTKINVLMPNWDVFKCSSWFSFLLRFLRLDVFTFVVHEQRPILWKLYVHHSDWRVGNLQFNTCEHEHHRRPGPVTKRPHPHLPANQNPELSVAHKAVYQPFTRSDLNVKHLLQNLSETENHRGDQGSSRLHLRCSRGTLENSEDTTWSTWFDSFTGWWWVKATSNNNVNIYYQTINRLVKEN